MCLLWQIGIITELVAAWACDLDLSPRDLKRLSQAKVPVESDMTKDNYEGTFPFPNDVVSPKLCTRRESA